MKKLDEVHMKAKILDRNGFRYNNNKGWWISGGLIITYDAVYGSSVEKLIDTIRNLKREEPKL